MKLLSVFAGTCLLLSTTLAVAAGDWPQFRGPHRDGCSTETGLLKAWPEGGPALRWKAAGLGKGYSSVSIVGDTLYVMGTRDDQECVIALDLATQREKWLTRIGPIFRDGQGDGPRCTPTVNDGLVYGLGGQGNLVALSAQDGREVWRKSMSADLGGKMMSSWGWSEAPLVDGDQLVCTPGLPASAFAALDKKTGAKRWQTTLPADLGPAGKDGAGYASIVISEAGGIRQYVNLLGRGLVGVAAKDGRYLWSYNRAASAVANCSSPVVSGDLVFGSSAYKTGSGLVQLTAAGDGIKATESYFIEPGTLQNHHGGMVLVDGFLYGGHGQNAGLPVCIELKTGRVAWRADQAPGGGSAAVLYADGQLYFRYERGQMALIKASPTAYALAGTFTIGSANGKHWAHPVIHDGLLYLRDQDTLLCYDLRAK